MALLKITRSNEYANRLRDIKIFLDGREIGRLANAETKEFEISSGDHILQARIDWCSSPETDFRIGEQQTASFQLTSFASHNPLGIFATIYYITLGANKYLHLQKV